MADPKQLKEGTNPLAKVGDLTGKDYLRSSNDLIHESIMRGGGEPFGAPFEMGVQSLTNKIVQFFKQRGFFGFEFLERPRSRRSRNKFTRYGAAPFKGDVGKRKKP